jgi:hypothetical protein
MIFFTGGVEDKWRKSSVGKEIARKKWRGGEWSIFAKKKKQ